MEPLKSLRIWFALTLILGLAAPTRADDLDWQRVSSTVASILERAHFSRQPIDDTISERVLENYLTGLDHSRLYFTGEDVARFERQYGVRMDEMVREGDLAAAMDIFDVYRHRVEQRVRKINLLLDNRRFTFDSDRTVEMSRENASWPANEEAADRLWHNIIENQLLTEQLRIDQAEVEKESAAEIVRRRYARLLRSVEQMDEEDVVKRFLSAVAQAFDPHSDYLSPRDLENFEISMRNSLVGIGAVLRSEDGYARIMELVQGGPAALGGRLRVKDRITAVAQGKEGEFVDVVDMKLDKVVEMIRGKRDTVVRLEVIPATSTDPSAREIVEIVRDEVTIKGSLAQGQLIEMPTEDGGVMRLGWIMIPSFYKDMNSSAADARSTTADVLAILERLKKEGMEGLVIDLRMNGGGALDEAVSLTGLFIKNGPVVQALNTDGIAQVSRDRNNQIAYDGPLVVLTSKVSASASEIFAAALQDYGRAVIVGEENTYGKGTVQTLVEIGRHLQNFLSLRPIQAGALKVTVQKFYRVAGGSTQQRGVESDIMLPSPLEALDVGEAKMRHALPYDTTSALEYQPVALQFPFEELRLRSAERVKQEPEFQYMREDAALRRELFEANAISLNAEERRRDMAENEARQEARRLERVARELELPTVFQVSLDDVEAPTLERISFLDSENGSQTYVLMEEEEGAERADVKGLSPLFDPVKLETLRILADLVEFSDPGRTAKAP